MGKNKGKLGGRNSNKGSKAYSQRVCVNDGQAVKANSIIIMNSFSLKADENTYSSKHNIHARVDGRVRIKDGKVRVERTFDFVGEGEDIFKAREIEKSHSLNF